MFVERLLEGDYSIARAPGSHHGMLHWAVVWEQPAVAYDLCHDAWPADFRKQVETFLWLWTRRIFNQHMMFNTQAQYDFGNGEAMWFHYGPALAGLAFWGEKGPEPVEPLAPDPVEKIPPNILYNHPKYEKRGLMSVHASCNCTRASISWVVSVALVLFLRFNINNQDILGSYKCLFIGSKSI